MSQTQFRSDDTQPWVDGYGNGSAGALDVSSNITDSASTDTITGTAAASSATFGNGSGFSNNDLILIHQTNGSGAGAWELNKIASGGGTTSVTLAYTLKNTYSSGAQVYQVKQYTTITIESGKTFSVQDYNGTKGGIMCLLATQSINVIGTISGVGAGFRGGTGGSGGDRQGRGGESEVRTNNTTATQSASGMGAGGGTPDTAAGDGGGGGGGGGHANAGSAGTATVNNSGQGGNAGQAGGDNAGLTIMLFGGAGGEGGLDDSGNPNPGGDGAAIVVLIAPTITITGAVNLNGADGNHNAVSGDGAPGAGGSLLMKGQTISLGSNLATALSGATSTGLGSGHAVAGAASVGRIHADYGQNISGTTNPSIDSRQDPTLNNNGGLIFLL